MSSAIFPMPRAWMASEVRFWRYICSYCLWRLTNSRSYSRDVAMAKKKKVAGADIDWYLISIERLKQIGLVLLLLILGGAGWWYWSHQKANPRGAAQAAIADARDALNSLAASKDFSHHRSEFDRAQKRLDEANSLLGGGRFTDAQSAAVESHTISRNALAGGERESDAQFLSIEGDVQYSKS